MATYRTILTNKGKQLEAEAAATGSQIQLTDMGVGDGNGNPVTPNPAQTSLARERYRASLNTLIVDPTNPSRFIAELVIPSSVGGFVMREVGLYTADGFLFAVANVPDTYKPTTEEGAFSDTVIRMVFVVDNASVVTIVLDPNVAVATRAWVLNNVNAGTLIPGGLTGQMLAKHSNADGDTEWIDPAGGITVIVFSREETQTLAASQTIIDLAEITAEGAAVYIEGVRLRKDEFTQTGPAQIALDSAHAAGTLVTIVQNEEVGSTDVLLRPLNLSDVPDKAVARTNLGLPNWIMTVTIQWSQLSGVPAFATRWPTWTEVTDKPATFPPSAHSQDWSTITGVPVYTTRWPQWTEVTNKPSLFPPSAHSHSEYVQKAGDTMTGNLSSSGTITGNSAGDGSAAAIGIGNDSQLWDVNIANAAALRGTANAALGRLYYGNTAKSYFGTSDSNSDITELGTGTYFQVTVSGGGLHYTYNNSQHIAQYKRAGSFSWYWRKNSTGTQAGTGEVGLMELNDNGALSTAGGFDFGSSRKLKDIEGPMPYGLAEVRTIATLVGRYKPEYNNDGRRRVFFDAEQFMEVMPEVVDAEGVEFNGERVPAIKLDQALPPAYRAIAELAALVDQLREEIAALKAGR